MSAYFYICLFACLSICLSTCLSAYLYVCPFACLPVSRFENVCRLCIFYVGLSMSYFRLPIFQDCLSICQPIRLSAYLSVCLFVCLSTCIYTCAYVRPSVRLSVCLSVCLCLSVCMSVLYICLSFVIVPRITLMRVGCLPSFIAIVEWRMEQCSTLNTHDRSSGWKFHLSSAHAHRHF